MDYAANGTDVAEFPGHADDIHIMQLLVTSLITAPRICRLVSVYAVAGLLPAGCAFSTGNPESSSLQPLTRIIYSDDGVSELTVPATWAIRPDFGRDAAIRVAEANGRSFLLINTYLPDEIAATTVDEFSRGYAQSLTDSLPNSTTSRGESFEISGAPAHRHVITGDVGDVRLTYVSTVIRGSTALHHLIGWTAEGDFRRNGTLDRVIASFRESPNRRPPRHRIALDFAWPESFQSAINFRQKSMTQGMETERKAIYLTSVNPGNENELVVSTRIMSQHSGAGQSGAVDYTHSLARQLSAAIPDYVVSRDGEFIRVVNLPAYQQRVETALMSSLPPDATAQKDKILALLRPGLSEKFLAASATNEWNKTVGAWVGSSYVPGQSYRFSEAYYSPPLGDTPFLMNVSRMVSGFSPCTGSKPDCVKLLQTATVSSDDFRIAMRRFLEKALGRQVRLKQITVVRHMEIIAEPDTLIPHRMRSTEETTVVIADADGTTHTSRDTEDTEVTYNYESYTALR